MFVIWILGMLLLWSFGGFLLYKIAEEEGDDFLMKHLIVAIAVLFVVGLIPIISLVGFLVAVTIAGCAIMDDVSTDSWWNKPAVKKNKLDLYALVGELVDPLP